MKECDITKVDTIIELFEVPGDQRDEAWKQRFYETVIDASFTCRYPQVFRGPDGFPYFALMSPEPLKAFESYCLCNILDFVTDNGFGVVINPGENGADWVFTLGDLVNLRLFNSFEAPNAKPGPKGPKTEILEKDEQVLIGGSVRRILARLRSRNLKTVFGQGSRA